MSLKNKKSPIFTAWTKSELYGDNITKHQLLHISGLIGPTSGNTKFTNGFNCNYNKGARQKY